MHSIKKEGQKLITVFGCGGDRDKGKRPKIAAECEKYSDAVIVTTDNSRSESDEEIIEDILRGFKSTEKRTVITSRKDAIIHAILMASDNDIVAIIGKGHERYSIDKNGIYRFDEREIISSALSKRN